MYVTMSGQHFEVSSQRTMSEKLRTPCGLLSIEEKKSNH